MPGTVHERSQSSRVVVRQGPAAPAAPVGDLALDEQDIRQISAELGEPAWLADRRLAAWSTYLTLPLPTTADEAWRRTDLRGLPLGSFRQQATPMAPVPPELLQPLAGDRHGALLVLRPGQPPERPDGAQPDAQGIVFADWASAIRDHADLLRERLGAAVGDDEGKFAALAAAVAREGVLVYVPDGVQAEAPLHSVLWMPGSGNLAASRVLVVLGRGASLTYVHEIASPAEPGGDSLHAGTVELVLGEGARLTFVELQNWGPSVWHFTHERARVARDASLDWIFGAVGSRLTKNFSDLDLLGTGAQGRMSGFYFAHGSQHLDHDTQQNHRAAHTTSDLLFKGALLGKSRSVWQGMIYVAPGAQKTDGYQANRNLVLSQQARADSIPGLEILADDVRCTHGATVGQLDPETVFYLMARGMTRRDAERLVVDGFFDPILQRIPFEGVRERFRGMVAEKMG